MIIHSNSKFQRGFKYYCVTMHSKSYFIWKLRFVIRKWKTNLIHMYLVFLFPIWEWDAQWGSQGRFPGGSEMNEEWLQFCLWLLLTVFPGYYCSLHFFRAGCSPEQENFRCFLKGQVLHIAWQWMRVWAALSFLCCRSFVNKFCGICDKDRDVHSVTSACVFPMGWFVILHPCQF